MNFIKKIIPLVFVLGLSYWAIAPFFLPGFFPMHDDTQVARVFEMHKALVDGQFPVRWVADLGYHYGYPIFNFYAPLAYYVGALFMVFGFDALSATKIMMALGVLLAGVFMYVLGKELWGKAGGLLSAILYVYAPYHALNVYVRGAVGEFWAYAFVPLVFFGVYKLFQVNSKVSTTRKNLWGVSIGALGYAAIIISHNLTAMMVTPFLLLFIFLLLVIVKQKKHFILYTFFLFILGLSFSAFYWLPVFTEMQYTNVTSVVGGGSDYKDHFVCPFQLWDSQWGYGGSAPTCVDGLSFMIGKLHILFFLFALISFVFLYRKNNISGSLGWFLIGSTAFSLFLLLKESKFLWDSISQMAFLQFPWRFLLMASFFISLFAGAGVLLIRKIIKHFIVFVLAVFVSLFVIIIFYQEVFVAQEYFSRSAKDYTTNETLWWKTSKISDEYMPKGFDKPKDIHDVPDTKIAPHPDVTVESIDEQTHIISAKLSVVKETDVLVRQAYFPGWVMQLDGKDISYQVTSKGLLVSVPPGEHRLTLQFEQSGVAKTANAISLAGIFILVIVIIKVIYGKKIT